MNVKHSFVDLTPNPYLAFGKQLGRDEVYAWLASTGATGVASVLLAAFAEDLPDATRAAILAVVGPLAEKPGLFLEYFRAELAKRRDAPADRRASWVAVFAETFRQGRATLITDLTCHDSIYSVLLWVVLQVAGGTSSLLSTILAGLCFFGAVAIASAVQVLFVDARYRLLGRQLKRAGFKDKSYFEARFMVDPDGDARFAPAEVLSRLQKHFRLPEQATHTYRDVYLTRHSLAVYNGRRPYLRFRQRLNEDGSVSKRAVQVMYTRSREVRDHRPGLYRCFATLKEKFGYDFPKDQPMPWTPADIADPKVAGLVKRLANAEEIKEVRFTRHVTKDPEGLFLSIDVPPQSPTPTGAYWLEVKSRADVAALRDASDYIAWKLPVRATTKTKCDTTWGIIKTPGKHTEVPNATT